jgi:hypothetical protein
MESIFENCEYKKKVSKKEPVDLSNLELKRIENNLNIWLKQKQKMKFEKVSLNNFDPENEDFDKLNDMINSEKKDYSCNKKWNKLTKSTQWRLILEYCEKNSISKDDINKMKKKLASENKNLSIHENIQYDHVKGEIESINLAFNQVDDQIS